ncbi:hypothetical protein LV476_03165 [Guyparkeria hydrothermalis]|uniref:hypothetical protein n=1 Tax=Guyparkeria hydrothermalis TaxID=923 RepID=UPI0020224E9F|nr:hypothetical protein [Guyparkeria hydrothermalis]MCL7743953.1 hypothetical protein [Guyparkeria hydrothermalis]
MLDYFLSSDWAIIATELLAGLLVITLILAFLVWRGQRRHTDAAERLLDDRNPILRASEEMVGRQAERVWPGMTLDDEQRQIYAERSLDAVEAMVEPWLEPKRHDLSSVARQFQRVRQEDLEQLLTLAHAHAEASQADDARVTELEEELRELREQRDRQANHLNDSLETVNVMVREYGRKFDYNEEPHVATVLKAIVMVQEMAAGADCETAQQRAEDVFSEDLVAAPAPKVEDTPAQATMEAQDEAAPETTPEITSPAAEPDEAMAASEPSTAKTTDSIDVGGEQTGQNAQDQAEAPAAEPATQATSAMESAGEAAASADDDIDALIAQAQASQDATAAASQAMVSGGETNEAGERESATTSTPGDEAGANAASTEVPTSTETSADESMELSEEDPEENGVIDLDDVEIPEEEKDKPQTESDAYDLDDIDALLDAEIAKKHGKS